MARGLFELRKDSVTGWWVATVVDREFDRRRFYRPAKQLAEFAEGRECANCGFAGGSGADAVQIRMLKPDAFLVAGTEREKRETQPDGREPELGLVGDAGSYQTIIAPAGHHERLADTTSEIAFELLARTRDVVLKARQDEQTAYLAVVQNYGRQAGALTDHLCFDFYDLPHIPHRIGEELGGAARSVIREGGCPFCRLVRDEVADPKRLVYEDSASVAFAPYASRSPFELWVVPRHHAADFGTATDAQLVSAADTLQKVLGLLGTLGDPPYNLVLHTAPLKERVEETFHWHWEIHPRFREIAGLELGTGLPLNPVSPEDAAAELLETARSAAIDTGVSGGRPTWDALAAREGMRS